MRTICAIVDTGGGSMSIFSENLKILRKQHEWTQRDLAEKLNVAETTVQKWERAKNKPQYDEAKRVADVLCLSLDELMEEPVDGPNNHVMEDWLGDCGTNGGRIFLDSAHDKCVNVKLRKNASLHRFRNHAGVLYSSICCDGYEVFSCERAHEEDMIDYWNHMDE